MANIITGFRVLISIALLFCPVFSPVFYILYLTGGLSDMIDGTIARKMNTVTEFGARFDTAADFVFVVVCLIKLLPVISMPVCAVATFAAVQEGHFIRTDPDIK